MQPMGLVTVIALLCIFGSPVLITWLIVNAKKKSLPGSADELAALRADMEQMRHQMDTNYADITLMLEDMRRDALPPADDD
jgi:hypothetical protein